MTAPAGLHISYAPVCDVGMKSGLYCAEPSLAVNLAQLRAFHAVAVHGKFSAAAQALGVSQPAITQHVKSLEQAAGTRLFRRTGNGVELTRDGQDFLPKVREAVLTLDDIGSRMENGRALRAGHLALGLCAPYLAMPILDRFSALHPGIRLDIRFDNSNRLLGLVAQHRIDIAIATLIEPDQDFACERLIDQRILILVPSGHSWWKRASVTAAELRGQRFVLREAGSMTRHLFERGLATRGVEIDAYLVLGSREAVKEATAAGLGLGIVLNREIGVDPRLRGIPVEDADMRAAEYLVALPDIRSRGAVGEFFEVARQIFPR